MSKVATRNIIISLIIALIAAGVFGFVIYEVKDKGEKLDYQIRVLGEEQTREASYNKLERTAIETAADREQLQNQFLLRESDSIDLLNRLEELATEVGVELEIEKLERVLVEEDQSEWIRTDVLFSGSRERVQKFIKIFENLPYVLRVNRVDMMRRTSTEWEVSLSMQMRLLEYDE
jgi:hypothetical protein